MLYLTGITPALSESLVECCVQLCAQAHERGIGVTFDINYRPALSSPEQAGEVLRTLAPYITCLIGNEEHLKMLLGISTDFGENEREARLADIVQKTRGQLGIEKIAVPVRRTPSASDAVVYAAYSDGKSFCMSAEHHIHVVDRVGSGDAFSAGLIYALAHGYPVQRAIEFAAASNAVKHTNLSDINFASVDEVGRVMLQAGFDVKR
jgi:2-dehydro-3-deoxygluconokinase